MRINVSLGPEPRERRTIPDVAGQAETDARHALIEAGFTVQSVDQPTSDAAESGIVVKQKPAAGGQALMGSQVVIYVGRLPAPAE